MQEKFTPSFLLQTSIRVLCVLLILFGFLVSIELMSSSLGLLGEDFAKQIILLTANPFVALFIGLLATSVIQSSSASTSMIVAVVASGALSLESAIPIVMGANIGTAVTSTIVSLGHITRKSEFRKAIAAATAHDFFNIIVALILFPLEYYTHVLSHISQWIATFLLHWETYEGFLTEPNVQIKNVVHFIAEFLGYNITLLLAFSLLSLFACLQLFSTLLKSSFLGRYKARLDKVVFGTPFKSLSWGIALTALMQSSSVISSLIVPLVATGKVSLRKAFPFLMGANLGTTLTTLLAAFYQSEAAISLAIVHLLFNLFGVSILFPIPKVRSIPIRLARQLGQATVKNRLIGFAYLLVIFFLIPFVLIYSFTIIN